MQCVFFFFLHHLKRIKIVVFVSKSLQLTESLFSEFSSIYVSSISVYLSQLELSWLFNVPPHNFNLLLSGCLFCVFTNCSCSIRFLHQFLLFLLFFFYLFSLIYDFDVILLWFNVFFFPHQTPYLDAWNWIRVSGCLYFLFFSLSFSNDFASLVFFFDGFSLNFLSSCIFGEEN